MMIFIAVLLTLIVLMLGFLITLVVHAGACLKQLTQHAQSFDETHKEQNRRAAILSHGEGIQLLRERLAAKLEGTSA